ncbi:MAG: protein kinase domain-containing protein [Dehalococcoidia bacterium]
MDLPRESDPIRQLLDRRLPWLIHGDLFSQQSFGVGPSPDQGWKLHVSATPLSALDVLEQTLPILLDEGVRFKVVGTRQGLLNLNTGIFGPAQIGKFITIYPSSDAQAVRLAAALDAATGGLRGPRVPSDRPFPPGSLVHYRYGAFRQRPELGPVVDGFPGGILSRSWRGGVFQVTDLQQRPAELCLLKEIGHDVGMDQYGRDASAWADNEAELLSRYAGDPFLPRLHDRFELDGNLYTVLEYLEGDSLASEYLEASASGEPMSLEQIVAVGRASAEALAHLHELGIIYRDFKPDNLIHTSDGHYRLIGFGNAYDTRNDPGPPLGLGTPPYFPPEQYRGEPPAPSDDVFALGAVLYALASGPAAGEQAGPDTGHANQLQPVALLHRKPLQELTPSFPEALAAVIDRALAGERGDRFATMAEAQAAFEGAIAGLEPSQSPAVALPAFASRLVAPATEEIGDPLALARAIGDALWAAAQDRGGGLCGATCSALTDDRLFSPDLYDGTAGIALFLAELARATEIVAYSDCAKGQPDGWPAQHGRWVGRNRVSTAARQG